MSHPYASKKLQKLPLWNCPSPDFVNPLRQKKKPNKNLTIFRFWLAHSHLFLFIYVLLVVFCAPASSYAVALSPGSRFRILPIFAARDSLVFHMVFTFIVQLFAREATTIFSLFSGSVLAF